MSSPASAPVHATGPRTSAGKAISSRNAFKHGLASGAMFTRGENPEEFEILYKSLREEHAPATPTEELLISDMARFHWLGRRAVRLQAFAIDTDNLPHLALMIRYQTTNHRAFHKSLTTFLTLRKQRVESTTQFVSQNKSKISGQPAKATIQNPFPPTTDEEPARKSNAASNRLPQGQRAAQGAPGHAR
jgi:hypothetical protein